MEMEEECSICMVSLSDGPTTRTECGHLFHAHCLLGWSHRSARCPVCRTRLSSIPTASRAVLALAPRDELGVRLRTIDGVVRVVRVNERTLGNAALHVGDTIVGYGAGCAEVSLAPLVEYVRGQIQAEAFVHLRLHGARVVWKDRPRLTWRDGWPWTDAGERVLACDDRVVNARRRLISWRPACRLRRTRKLLVETGSGGAQKAR